jgi:hypothetical protein
MALNDIEDKDFDEMTVAEIFKWYESHTVEEGIERLKRLNHKHYLIPILEAEFKGD